MPCVIHTHPRFAVVSCSFFKHIYIQNRKEWKDMNVSFICTHTHTFTYFSLSVSCALFLKWLDSLEETRDQEPDTSDRSHACKRRHRLLLLRIPISHHNHRGRRVITLTIVVSQIETKKNPEKTDNMGWQRKEFK
jgi:hypothetical protein